MSHDKRTATLFSKTNRLFICCEKNTKYLNKICEGETKFGALVQILRVILRF